MNRVLVLIAVALIALAVLYTLLILGVVTQAITCDFPDDVYVTSYNWKVIIAMYCQ